MSNKEDMQILTAYEQHYMGLILNLFNNGYLSKDSHRKEIANQVLVVDLSKESAVLRTFAIDYESVISEFIKSEFKSEYMRGDRNLRGTKFEPRCIGDSTNATVLISMTDVLHELPKQVFFYAMLTHLFSSTAVVEPTKLPGTLTILIGNAYISDQDSGEEGNLERYMEQQRLLTCAAYMDNKDTLVAASKMTPMDPSQAIAKNTSADILKGMESVTEVEIAVAKSNPSIWINPKRKNADALLNGDIVLQDYRALPALTNVGIGGLDFDSYEKTTFSKVSSNNSTN